MKLILLILGLACLTPACYALPGDTEELGYINKLSVTDVLKQLGYPNMTCVEGKRTEDVKGYTIVADCVKAGSHYLAVLWVSLDWKEGRVISVTRRS